MSCPTGKKVIGTGGVAHGKYPNQLDTVAPSSALDGVLVEAALAESDGPPSSEYGAQAYAVCVNPVPGCGWRPVAADSPPRARPSR
ncbi:hypothetical protein O7632_22105 [Solwaraspora sp. WMMD406]|uniref:hypothetical protein n=1 Tax=Solwaraspora sp. WMMD406 TaxID=3016095 RepID=UPI002417FB0C|nr:hypothetical protein [Solwaraspora sp. WMMD406]MDG4766771.1 hypothetical protein [Solwaraspora sp. WMMD406]